MSFVKQYEYRPLSDPLDIRILVLQPAKDFDANLVAELQHWPWLLRQGLQRTHHGGHTEHQVYEKEVSTKCYEAISYAWGTEETTASLNIATDQGTFALSIRPNVATMFRYLRLSEEPRSLWIDAICINQADVIEKEAQVQLMGSVYRNARTVLIWLGTADEAECGVFTFPFLKTIALYKELPSILEKTVKQFTLAYLRVEPHLLGCSWFYRRWIIQEAVLAHEAVMICGHGSICFDIFVKAIRVIYNWYFDKYTVGFYPMVLQRLNAILELRASERPQTSQSFLELVFDCWAAQCIDDRDRLYSVSGLSSTPLAINYTLSTEEVYLRFASQEVLRNPEMLSYSGAFRSSTGILATWIPDWRSTLHCVPIADNLRHSDRKPRRTGSGNISISGSILTIEGSRLGIVNRIGNQSSTTAEHQEMKPLLKAWYELCLDSDKDTALSEESRIRTSDDIFLDTVTNGAVRLQHGEAINQADGMAFEALIDTIRSPYRPCFEPERAVPPSTRVSQSDTANPPNTDGSIRSGLSPSTCTEPNNTERHDGSPQSEVSHDIAPHQISHDSDDYNFFCIEVAQVMPGRCCFSTDSGDFGMGPADTNVGDVLVMIPGCRPLCVLRPSNKKNDDSMTLVGDCFIQRFMEDISYDIPCRTFHIR